MNILITSASRKVYLIKAFKEAIQELGGKVIAADSNLFSAAFFFADKYYVLPEDSDPNFLKEIIKICKNNKVELIVPTRDEELVIFSKNKGKLKKQGIEVMVAEHKVIEICQDKLKFFNFCHQNNLGAPRTYSSSDAKDNSVKFPLFLNGRISKAAKNAFKINNREELKLFLKVVKKPVIEEYIDTKEYTIDLFSDFDGNVISVVPRERIKVFGGESIVSKTFKNKKLIDESVRLAKKVGLVGHNTIQCFFNGKEVKFFEVNPRYGGGVNLSFAAGVNTPLFLVKIRKGEKLKPQIGKFIDKLVMLRYTEDFFIEERKLNEKRN